jgi:hypothetical protein
MITYLHIRVKYSVKFVGELMLPWREWSRMSGYEYTASMAPYSRTKSKAHGGLVELYTSECL